MSQRTRVCVISPEIVGPHTNGGIGTHCYYLCAFLSQQMGQEVTFLYTGKIERRTEAHWQEWFRRHLGVEFAWLRPNSNPAQTPAEMKSGFIDTARRVYDWLKKRPFEVCYFQEMLGNGFRCFQAKRLGLAFRETVLLCTVHSSTEWVSQAMQAFPEGGIPEVQTKFMERYSIEHCDLLLSPSEYMLGWLEENQFRTPAKKLILPYLFDADLPPVGCRPPANHVIFFGRLEVRKGLLLFLDALEVLGREGALAGRPLRVTFLGRPGYTPDGGGLQTIEKFRRRCSPSLRLELVTDLGHSEAMSFLSNHNDALVVCPSLVDNSPYAVIESLQLGVNLIAARTGGIPELFAGEERLFKPEPADLAAKIRAGLNNELPAPAKRYDLERTRQLWGEFCQKTLPSFHKHAAQSTPAPAARVAVFVGPGASDHTLTRVLKSLEQQSRKVHSVTVASEQPPEPNATRDYLLFLTAGCIPQPDLVARMVGALEWSGLDLLSCCAEARSGHKPDTRLLYEPLGPCLEGGFMVNLLGAGCVMVRAGRGNGRPPPGPPWTQPHGLWRFLAETSLANGSWDVVPDLLVTIENPEAEFLEAAIAYSAQVALLEKWSNGSPLWLRYLLLNAVGHGKKLLATEKELQDLRRHQGFSPGRVARKVKREAKRMLKQLKNLREP
jgi:glycosyltransferase involved in cell wall biosynthesis